LDGSGLAIRPKSPKLGRRSLLSTKTFVFHSFDFLKRAFGGSNIGSNFSHSSLPTKAAMTARMELIDLKVSTIEIKLIH
jgi:O-acetylhomoserine/O-acetylserine sulfhydrylase-like pyridoxal-dependent enzyme